MKHNRSVLDQLIEILEFCREPHQKTEIIFRTNMTHADTNKRLKILTDSNTTKASLLNIIKIKYKKVAKEEYYYKEFYKTTNVGIEWLKNIKENLFMVGL